MEGSRKWALDRGWWTLWCCFLGLVLGWERHGSPGLLGCADSPLLSLEHGLWDLGKGEGPPSTGLMRWPVFRAAAGARGDLTPGFGSYHRDYPVTPGRRSLQEARVRTAAVGVPEVWSRGGA